MPIIKIRGTDYNIVLARDSFIRRATQYTNNIALSFRKIGLTTNDIKVSEERMPMKRAPASVTWWIDDFHCHYSFNKMPKYVDNVLVVSKVIEDYVTRLVNNEMDKREFIQMFQEDKGFDEKQLAARKFFELEENHIDLDIINQKYKKLAKTLHPDMPNGDIDKFKELNEHHKTLKRELE